MICTDTLIVDRRNIQPVDGFIQGLDLVEWLSHKQTKQTKK